MIVDVGPLDDFAESQPRIVNANDRELTVVRWRDTIYAMRNICPHMGARLSDGHVDALLSCEAPFEPVDTDERNPVIRCPWHGWTFRLETGASAFDPERYRVRSYPVAVDEGRVLVDMAGRRLESVGA